MRANVLEVLILISRIDTQKVVRIGYLVYEQVIDKCALLGHQPGVMRLPDHKFGSVVTGDVLDEFKRPWPANFNFAHVADVE